MNKPPLEKEVKFYLIDLAGYAERLRSLGATLIQPRVKEINYRFDTPESTLARSGIALRLRRDTRVILTLKGASSTESGVRVRPEVEVVLDDMQNGRAILEGLGYNLVVCYEKWRTTYHLAELEVTLDELPYGNFTEIEGSDTEAIYRAASSLGLNWKARVPSSYLELFANVKRKLNLPVDDLTFKEFRGISLSCADLGGIPADLPDFL